MAKRKADQDGVPSKIKMDVDGEDGGSDSDESNVDVDFEFFGLNPEIDFTGLKMLLKQLLDVDNEIFNLSELADIILNQANDVGTAVKCDGEENDPYAFISVLGMQQHKDTETVKTITRYLIARTAHDAKLKGILSNPSNNIGLILSERFINMPHQVVPALYNMLQREISLGGDTFKLTHFLVLSKTYVEVQSSLDDGSDRPQKKQRSASASGETLYFHPEDEVLQRHAAAYTSFEYEKENDAGRSDSKRAFQEAGIKSQGHVVMIEASKFDDAIKDMTEYFSAG